MKKIVLSTLFAVIISVSAFAQAVLPTSYDWALSTSLPTGWTIAGGFTTYPASGNPAPSGKFQASGDMLTIDFTTLPGDVTYDIKANTANSAAYTSTFLVEESADGTSWSTLHSHTSLSITAYTSFTDTPLSTSRFIRFNLSIKASGNISLDNVTIAVAPAGPTQQINVKQGTTPILNGGTYTLSSAVSTLIATTFTIENLGTVNSLTISATALSGAAAGDFSVVTATPFSIASTSDSSLVVNFTPSAAGTRDAILTITNDDPNASSYIIYLNGIGGTFATEPTAQATGMIFPIVKSYLLKGQYTGASPAPDGYIVLRRTGAAITDVPVDGTVYERGDMIGNSKVVISTNSMSTTTFTLKDIVASTDYYFVVFSFNGVGAYRNYLTPSPLAGNITSSGSMQPTGYYSSISTSASTLITDLHAITNPHTLQFYSSYGALMASTIYSRDTTGDQRVITCVYSGENKIYTEPFDWTANNFSREHTYCQSWQPTVNDGNFQSRPEYNDYHMITPTNQIQVNGIRSNNPLGIVVGTPLSSYLDSKIGYNSQGKKVFEPRDADKGDAARCMFYQCIAYTGVAYTGPANTNVTYGGSWSLPSYISNSIPYGQDQNILKTWSEQDPPDNFEIARNDYVDSLQENRNPFIDHPEYICFIDFVTMTKIASPNVPCDAETLGITDNQKNNDLISLSPNPTNGNFVVSFTSAKNQKINVKLVDVLGHIVYSKDLQVTSGNNPIEMSIPNLKSGIYFFELLSENGKQTEKLVID